MWNLNEDDVRRAIEELKGRRDAIQARYDTEMKKLDADFADLETFERLALKIASDSRGAAAPPAAAPVAAPSPAPEIIAAVTPREQSGATSPTAPAEQSAEPEPAADPEAAGAPKGSSRWRMRLGAAGEAPR